MVSFSIADDGTGSASRAIHGQDAGVTRRIDLNCDLGETTLPWHESHEPTLMDLVTSANVACGGHAGDDSSMHAVCERAAELGVTIGAQVSYPDRENFGRVRMTLAPTALADTLHHQYAVLAAIARSHGTRVSYVKPHGALYNAVVREPDHADVVVNLARHHGVALFGLPNSMTESLAAEHGVRFVREWFADRGYLANGELVPRSRPDALVTDPSLVASRVARLIRDGVVDCVDGVALRLECNTICVHSDTPDAARLLRAVRDALSREMVVIGAV